MLAKENTSNGWRAVFILYEECHVDHSLVILEEKLVTIKRITFPFFFLLGYYHNSTIAREKGVVLMK